MRLRQPVVSVMGSNFPLLSAAASLAGPCDAFAHALARASASCRDLERRARAALREPAGSFGPATEALFDLVATSDLLPQTVPAGRIPKDLVARCLAVARSRREALAAEAAAWRAARTIVRRWRAAQNSPAEEHLTQSTKVRLALEVPVDDFRA